MPQVQLVAGRLELETQGRARSEIQGELMRRAGRGAGDRTGEAAVDHPVQMAAQDALDLRVGSDDHAKVYLNGDRIHRVVASRNFRPDQDTVTGVALRKGVNVFVFKVVNERGEWAGSLRLTDKDGRPVPGVRFITSVNAPARTKRGGAGAERPSRSGGR